MNTARTLSLVISLGCLPLAVTWADYRADIGYEAWLQQRAALYAPGWSVRVGQVEGTEAVDDDNNPQTDAVPAWLPEPKPEYFRGKSFNHPPQAVAITYSGHATSVGKMFYGLESVASGIRTIDNYSAAQWLGANYLKSGQDGGLPSIIQARVVNHSWISKPSSISFTLRALRHLDWLIDRDEIIQVAAITKGNTAWPVNGAALNTITVSTVTGDQTVNLPVLDAVYHENRTRPDLVVPVAYPSTASPIVASVAAMLVGDAHDDSLLSNDPMGTQKYTRDSGLILNAERAVVIRAILMAAAQRVTHNHSSDNITGYRTNPTLQGMNGLDRRYGAGQVNIPISYAILTAGEQNSIEDMPTESPIKPDGFDYDPQFGDEYNGSNQEASYILQTGERRSLIQASLAWNAKINLREEKAELSNLNLYIYDISADPVLVASSESSVDNTENIWQTLEPNKQYKIVVRYADTLPASTADYALAWHIEQDIDGDKVPDSADNCTLIANFDQRDTNNDGFGNICDPDLNNDRITDGLDLAIFRSRLGTNDKDADLVNRGYVNVESSAIIRRYTGLPPGPSGIAPTFE